MAERVGFEPTVRETAHLISNQAHSTTLAPLHAIYVLQPGAWRRQHTWFDFFAAGRRSHDAAPVIVGGASGPDYRGGTPLPRHLPPPQHREISGGRIVLNAVDVRQTS